MLAFTIKAHCLNTLSYMSLSYYTSTCLQSTSAPLQGEFIGTSSYSHINSLFCPLASCLQLQIHLCHKLTLIFNLSSISLCKHCQCHQPVTIISDCCHCHMNGCHYLGKSMCGDSSRISHSFKVCFHKLCIQNFVVEIFKLCMPQLSVCLLQLNSASDCPNPPNNHCNSLLTVIRPQQNFLWKRALWVVYMCCRCQKKLL